MSIFQRSACALLLTFGIASSAQAASPIPQRDTLGATLWVQRSAEFQFSTEQVYKTATAQLRAALRPGTAALEQEQLGHYAKLPPAVILDIDETVLDNSAYQGWALQQGAPYSEENFQIWVRMKQAPEIPGAAAFTRAAEKMGIKVFYVTNRACEKPATATTPAVCPEKTDTMENMARHGFARANDPAAFQLLGEQPDWVSNKTTRRALLAKTHRIVMLIGDDLKDILPGDTVNALRRDSDRSAYKKYLARFGQRWFILPNPVYGSWERVLPAALDARYALLDAAPMVPLPLPDKLAANDAANAGKPTTGDRLYCATAEGKADIAYCATILPR